MNSSSHIPELIRTLLAVLLIALLLFGCYWVLRPFIQGMLWASLIVVASWPLMSGVQAKVGGRRGLAVAIVIVILTLVVFLPIVLSLLTLIDNADALIAWVSSAREGFLATPPDWVVGLPVVGPKVATEWPRLLASGPGSLMGSITAHGREIAAWLIARAGTLGSALLHFTITIIVAALLFLNGEKVAAFMRRLAMRLGGAHIDMLVTLAGETVRAVALGIVVTAMVQSVIGGIGLAIAGVPFAAVLTSLMLMLCLAQLGPGPILIPAVIWLFLQGHTWQGVVLLVFTVFGLTLDNVLRPLLIQRGADMPFLMVFAGSIGGLVGFGLFGLFVGPVLLLVTSVLVNAWIERDVPQNAREAVR
ncbi:AI-2E family transporter YdiK [Uliginosibacterium sp. H3]|uniref:AI-2E family transporter YdiK n=1 Tax=Uliginosibacterium silvisoli TaxID=3114758 RepID=A0ABU6K1J3_9RHOO|nr:AI-2E family transporter YdiK [Uliginosibacterium sp. H3]